MTASDPLQLRQRAQPIGAVVKMMKEAHAGDEVDTVVRQIDIEPTREMEDATLAAINELVDRPFPKALSLGVKNRI